MRKKYSIYTALSEVKFGENTLNRCSRLSVVSQFLYGAISLFLIGQEGDSLFDTQTIAMMVFLLSPVIIVHAINWLLQTCKWSHFAFIFGGVLQVFVGGIVLPALKDYSDAEQATFGSLFLLFWYLVIHCLQDPQGEMDRFIKFCSVICKIDRRWYIGVLGILTLLAIVSAYLDEVKRKNQLSLADDDWDKLALEVKAESEAQSVKRNLIGILDTNPDKQAEISRLSEKSDVPTFSIGSPENEVWFKSLTRMDDLNPDEVVETPPASK